MDFLGKKIIFFRSFVFFLYCKLGYDSILIFDNLTIDNLINMIIFPIVQYN